MLLNSNAEEIIQQKRAVFADNDYLGLIYANKELLKDTLSILSGKKLYLHPFTEFEFLRDVFVPGVRKLKEEFISSQAFGHISEETHLKIFSKLLENAMLLSKIFAQKSIGGTNKKISFVDLMLASLLMYLKNKAVLITGNKKDFSSFVFDVVAVINFEETNGSIRAISIVDFNQSKFDNCLEDLQKLDQPSVKQSTNNVSIKIPKEASALQLKALKDAFLSSPGSTRVELLFGDSKSLKKIELPFTIEFNEELKNKISKIL